MTHDLRVFIDKGGFVWRTLPLGQALCIGVGEVVILRQDGSITTPDSPTEMVVANHDGDELALPIGYLSNLVEQYQKGMEA